MVYPFLSLRVLWPRSEFVEHDPRLGQRARSGVINITPGKDSHLAGMGAYATGNSSCQDPPAPTTPALASAAPPPGPDHATP